MEYVHFRTLPTPQDAHEDAIRQALEQLEVAARNAEHGSLGDRSDAMADARDAARVVRRTWDVLPAESPYRDVLADAGRLVAQVSELGWDVAPTSARDLEEERADLLLLDARVPVMRAVRTALAQMGVREVARSAGLSAGRVSELSNGRGGLAHERTARALEEVAGPGLQEIVLRARAEASSIKREAGRREREINHGDRDSPTAADALMRLNLALGDDPELLALFQKIIALPGAARRALSTLLSAPS